jgi:hypothetical protein
VAGPDWADDHPADAARIGVNCGALLADLAAAAAQRALPTLADACGWHRRIYDGCAVPADCYVGNFRGDPAYPELADYEVGVGAMLADGLPEKMGVWTADVGMALAAFIAGVQAALGVLDAVIPAGSLPATVDELHEVVVLTAEVHGEWVRVHPFANGNGRTARIWAAFLALRYGLPVFVALKPRPGDIAYVRAAMRSMGRPPGFDGDHGEAVAVFAHLLTLSLLP